MPGGFLSGLGQGLQQAGGVVQNFQAQKEKDKLIAEDQRRWTLEQALAERSRRDRANQAGVEDLYRQGALMQDQDQFNTSQGNLQRNADRAMGLDIMGMERSAYDADQQRLLTKQSIDQQGEYYRGQNANNANRYTDRMYGAQILRPMISAIDAEITKLEAQLGGVKGMITLDPEKNRVNAQLERLLKSKQTLMQEMGKQMDLTPGSMDALMKALDPNSASPYTVTPGSGPPVDPTQPVNPNPLSLERPGRRPFGGG